MTTIPGATDNNYNAYGLGVQPTAHKSSLGQADFLRLMTEQLKNQDPLKPLDNAQFLGQLAQFSTVQGIDSMQGAMNSMASVMESDQALRAATLVGHDALVNADSLTLTAGSGVHGEIAATSAGPMQVEIVASSRSLTRRRSRSPARVVTAVAGSEGATDRISRSAARVSAAGSPSTRSAKTGDSSTPR